MIPKLMKVEVPNWTSFGTNRYSYAGKFPGIWHYHDEYELTLILESGGTRMVGDHIGRFERGDLILIGRNLPHTWRTDCLGKSGKAEALVLHFLKDSLGSGFFGIPEMKKVGALLERSHRGIQILGRTRDQIQRMLEHMEGALEGEKVILLLSILHALSQSSDLRELSSEIFADSTDDVDEARFNEVYEYIMNNFQEDLTLNQVADAVNMSPSAFSRYFKRRVRKPFKQFIIELRVGYACKLLMMKDVSVSEVCYESGFQNLSNFNNQFKNITKFTPKKYQLIHADRLQMNYQ